MRVLLDEGLSFAAAAILRNRGVDAIHAREAGLAAASDEEILASCVRETRIVITLDADFHALLASAGASRPSVIRIRIERLRDERLASLIMTVLDQVAEFITDGAAVTVTESAVRTRRLPLGIADE